MSYLLLKWGTAKEWDFTDDNETFEVFQEFLSESSSSSALDDLNAKCRKILCNVIDRMNGKIEKDWDNIIKDWDNTILSKDEAKKYIMEY